MASLGTYALGSNAFAKPDDYLVFIETNAEALLKAAKKAHLEHRRGVVLLEGKPHGESVRASYAEPTADELESFGPTAAEDFYGYDPAGEMLAGVTDASTFTQFWRFDWR